MTSFRTWPMRYATHCIPTLFRLAEISALTFPCLSCIILISPSLIKTMAKNTNKRIPVKWVRDRAKAAYTKQAQCYVCGTQQDLELHHLHSITILLDTWASACGHDISTDEGILAVRDEFIEKHHHELYDLVYTLCNHHHVALHGVYGKAPPPGSEARQQRWIEIQRQKHETGNRPIPTSGSFFSEFT